jgi:hypothetical protein
MSVEDNVVVVDALDDLEKTVNEVASGSIARRLRHRKGKNADVVAKPTKSVKRDMIGPNRRSSKVEVPSQKK